MPVIVGSWVPAPMAVHTPEDRLQLTARLCDSEKTAEIAVYAHGTAVGRVPGARMSLDDIMRAYDVPFDGEGSPYGDIVPTMFDDGSCLYSWPLISDDGMPQGFAMYVAIASELGLEEIGDAPPGLPFDPEDITILHVGLAARWRRGRDARECQRVAHWKR